MQKYREFVGGALSYVLMCVVVYSLTAAKAENTLFRWIWCTKNFNVQ